MAEIGGIHHERGSDWNDNDILDAENMNYIQSMAIEAKRDITQLQANVVTYTRQEEITAGQQAIARANIGFTDAVESMSVLYNKDQSLTNAQQQTARNNIDAPSKDNVNKLANLFTNIIPAAEYSSNSTYQVGSYCLHDTYLYRCINAITSGKAWSANDWESITLIEKLDESLAAVDESLAAVYSARTTINDYIANYPNKITFNYTRATADGVTTDTIVVDVPTGNTTDMKIRYVFVFDKTLLKWNLENINFYRANEDENEEADDIELMRFNTPIITIKNNSNVEYSVTTTTTAASIPAAKIFIDNEQLALPVDTVTDYRIKNRICSNVRIMQKFTLDYTKDAQTITSPSVYKRNYIITNDGLDTNEAIIWKTNNNTSAFSQAKCSTTSKYQDFSLTNYFGSFINDDNYQVKTYSDSGFSPEDFDLNYAFFTGRNGNIKDSKLRSNLSLTYNKYYNYNPVHMHLTRTTIQNDGNSTYRCDGYMQLFTTEQSIPNNTTWRWGTTITASARVTKSSINNNSESAN